MTITRSFYRFATLFLLGVLGGTGMASAQQGTANQADTQLSRDAASVNPHRQQAKLNRPQGEHATAMPGQTKRRLANTLDPAGNHAGGDHYRLSQRNLIRPYQNAVTPPMDVQR